MRICQTRNSNFFKGVGACGYQASSPPSLPASFPLHQDTPTHTLSHAGARAHWLKWCSVKAMVGWRYTWYAGIMWMMSIKFAQSFTHLGFGKPVRMSCGTLLPNAMYPAVATACGGE